MGRLTVKQVQNITRLGWHSDAGGHGLALYVQRKAGGGVTKSWGQRLTINSKATTLGLGSVSYVTLAEAREKARENYLIAKKGGDPRRPTDEPTFREAAEIVIAERRGAWRKGGKSEQSWRSTLHTYVFPVLGDKLVSEVNSANIKDALLPIWHQKHETAERTRSRISIILNWAITEGYRVDDPARKRAMDSLGKVKRPRQHQRSLPYQEVGTALAKIHQSGAAPITKMAIEFLILTASRPGEVRGCCWSEVDLSNATWIIPPDRYKTGEQHQVALSRRAVGILRAAQKLSDGENELVFPGENGKKMSENRMNKLLRDLQLDGTSHGMRASFRTWCSDTAKPRELAEAAMGHKVRGVEGAYARSDLLERRRPLMQEWADYLTGTPSKTP